MLAFAVAGALLGLLVVGQHAAAYGTNYCNGWLPAGGSCLGPQHSLTANIAYDNTGNGAWICENAQYPGGGLAGSWVCAGGEAEGCFSGNTLLKGEVYNDSGGWLALVGTEYYGQGCP